MAIVRLPSVCKSLSYAHKKSEQVAILSQKGNLNATVLIVPCYSQMLYRADPTWVNVQTILAVKICVLLSSARYTGALDILESCRRYVKLIEANIEPFVGGGSGWGDASITTTNTTTAIGICA